MIYSFGPFELDTARAEFREDGQVRSIEPQVFALLALLIEHRDRLVPREEIFEKIWEARIVTDSALSSRIKSARRLLGDDGRSQRYIRTVHGQGLRFVADVRLRRESDNDVLTALSEDAARDVAADGAGGTARPSIAVLPFRAIGEAAHAATIAEGLPHELITELSRLRWLFVVARGSSFRLRGETADPCEAGRLLGVRYCLSGMVEVSGQQLAVTTELVDTRAGDVVWAERYTGRIEDMHAMRGEIRASTLASLEIQIPLHEASSARLRNSESLDAWAAYHLGLQHVYRFSRRDNALAAELFTRAVTQDPGFARAHAGLSFVHFQTAFLRHTNDFAADLERARSHAQRGMDIDPLDPFVNFTMGRSYWLEGDLDRASAWLERATSLSPNYAQGLYAQAWTQIMAGSPDAAREHLDLAMRLSPLDPLNYAMLSARGLIHIALSEDAEGAQWAERGARSPGAHALIAMIAAAAQALAGNPMAGIRWAEEVRRRNPALTQADFFGAFPIRTQDMRGRLARALTSVGFD
ncbi:MAG: winged helix-turn-helix domain-containing protein [Gammaproteobacteria bacterium]|jgi:TolB-like protein